jgi:hypothetical protein
MFLFFEGGKSQFLFSDDVTFERKEKIFFSSFKLMPLRTLYWVEKRLLTKIETRLVLRARDESGKTVLCLFHTRQPSQIDVLFGLDHDRLGCISDCTPGPSTSSRTAPPGNAIIASTKPLLRLY